MTRTLKISDLSLSIKDLDLNKDDYKCIRKETRKKWRK